MTMHRTVGLELMLLLICEQLMLIGKNNTAIKNCRFINIAFRFESTENVIIRVATKHTFLF